jgi:beta-glucosidase
MKLLFLFRWDLPVLDMNLIERTARIAAQEASADGINWTFPMEISLVIPLEEYLKVQEKILLGSQIAKAMVKGYQGDDLSPNNTILHKMLFLYGAPEGGRL